MALGERAARRQAEGSKGWSKRRWFAVALQSLFVGWVVYQVGGGLWRLSAGAQWAVPHELAGLGLVESSSGEQAVHEMTKLHGKDVEVRDGYVARYRGQGAEVVLYVGQVADARAAADLSERMGALIAGGNGPFKGLRRVEAGGRSVYYGSGLGAEHYFYQVDDKVVWLQVAGMKPEAALSAVLANVR